MVNKVFIPYSLLVDKILGLFASKVFLYGKLDMSQIMEVYVWKDNK